MLFKLSHRELNGAFQRWGENVKEVKALRTRAARALNRFRNRTIAGAWQGGAS